MQEKQFFFFFSDLYTQIIILHCILPCSDNKSPKPSPWMCTHIDDKFYHIAGIISAHGVLSVNTYKGNENWESSALCGTWSRYIFPNAIVVRFRVAGVIFFLVTGEKRARHLRNRHADITNDTMGTTITVTTWTLLYYLSIYIYKFVPCNIILPWSRAIIFLYS